jgi:hypothetical protein
VELSWLVPLPHFLEITGGVYDGITGHTHDTDPAAADAAWGPDNPPPGCHFHGDEIHCPDNPELEAEYWAAVGDPDGPVRGRTNLGAGDLAWLGRVKSSLELGLDWSVDLGTSVIHQPRFKRSQRFPGETYEKTVFGADLTVFRNVPEQNLYRGLDFGVEFLANREEFEVEHEGTYYRDRLTRAGLFGHARYRWSRRWEFGAFGETFAPRLGRDDNRKRYGGFLTWRPSHFQAVTLEVTRYETCPDEDALHQLVIQYDGTIGYHTHGSQR